jgi:hypothetical protein
VNRRPLKDRSGRTWATRRRLAVPRPVARQGEHAKMILLAKSAGHLRSDQS